ncbi:MAG: hypothetical protein HYX99_04015, partial [Chloroflexi bacterium]|nr:hypothetical protein [Chloroflexota bacterium]
MNNVEIVERGTAGRPLAGGRLAVEGTPGLTPFVVVESPPIRLYRADCLEAMRRLLGDGTVSVVVTSPPYNIGTRYNVYQDSQPREEYLAWIEQVGL